MYKKYIIMGNIYCNFIAHSKIKSDKNFKYVNGSKCQKIVL